MFYLEERVFTPSLKFAFFSGPVRPNLGFSGSVQYFQVTVFARNKFSSYFFNQNLFPSRT